MNENMAIEKSFAFAVRIVNLHKFMAQKNKEYVLSKQILAAEPALVQM